VLIRECRVNLAEPDPGAGLDDESLAVVHSRSFSYNLDVEFSKRADSPKRLE
jgi:hypothetical protein